VPILSCCEAASWLRRDPAYRGYFALRKARSWGGVAAYSTLGHFDDPILNTMMGWNDTELAAIVFHELTHQLLYLPGDASFNEAFATTVEEEGVRRWLSAQGRDADLAEHVAQQQRYLEVIDLLRRTRAELRTLYASGSCGNASALDLPPCAIPTWTSRRGGAATHRSVRGRDKQRASRVGRDLL
jgi:predicted aminopeptidase